MVSLVGTDKMSSNGYEWQWDETPIFASFEISRTEIGNA